MKIKSYLTSFSILSLLICSFTTNKKNTVNPPAKSYNLFYVDNSSVKGYESFSQDLFDILDKKVDSLKDNKSSYIGFFSSNGQRSSFASNYKGAKDIISKLSAGYTSTPSSLFDKNKIMGELLNSDFSNTKSLNIHFFVTEAFINNDILSGNSGLLLNVLPRELQNLIGCDDDKVSIFIYYPGSAKKTVIENLKKSLNFSNLHKDFASKGQVYFLPV